MIKQIIAGILGGTLATCLKPAVELSQTQTIILAALFGVLFNLLVSL